MSVGNPGTLTCHRSLRGFRPEATLATKHAPTVDSFAFSVRSVFRTDRHGTSFAKQEERVRGDICSGTVLCGVDRNSRGYGYGLEHDRRGDHRYLCMIVRNHLQTKLSLFRGCLVAIGRAMEHWTEMFQILSVSRALRFGKPSSVAAYTELETL